MQALDETKEAWEVAKIRLRKYQKIAAQHLNKGVKPKKIQVEDYLLRKVFQNIQEISSKNGKDRIK